MGEKYILKCNKTLVALLTLTKVRLLFVDHFVHVVCIAIDIHHIGNVSDIYIGNVMRINYMLRKRKLILVSANKTHKEVKLKLHILLTSTL